MSDLSPERAQGLRVGLVSVLVLLAFLVGLGLAIALVRHQSPANGPAAAPALAQPAAPATTPTATPTPTPDPAALQARTAELGGQIAALEARTAALTASADAAGGQAARAEALLVAVGARRALDRGAPLGELEGQLRARLGSAQPQAVAIVREAARTPITLDELRAGLDALAPVLTTGADRGWLASVRQGLATLVVLRRAGTPSSLPADRLARARRLLDAGAIDAARAEVAQLPGAAKATAWLDAARRFAQARQALDVLENAALAGQARPAPPLALP